MSHFALSNNWLRQSQKLDEYELSLCFAGKLKAVKAMMQYTKTRYKTQFLVSVGRQHQIWLRKKEFNSIGSLRCSFL